MPPRRKAPKSKAASAASRVHKITSREQWDAMMRKAGNNRLVIVQFYQGHVWTCKQMKPYFVRYSTQPKFRKAIFAEVDVDELEDLARSQNIKRIPSYQCYWEGKKADSYEGGTPDQLNEFIARNIKEYSSSGGPLALALKLAAAAAIVAGGTFLAVRYSSGKEDETSIDAGGEILELKKRIMVAQGRLRVMEKANRGKQARAQRKLIEQLNAQVRLLERKDQATGKAGSAGTAGGGTQGKGGAAGAGAGRGAAAAAGSNTRRGRRELSIEDLARLRRRKARGDVLYSDEEDTLAADEASGAW